MSEVRNLDSLDSYVMPHDEKVVYCDRLRNSVIDYMKKKYPTTDVEDDAGEFGSADYQQKFIDGVMSRAFFLAFREPEDFDRTGFRHYIQNELQSTLPKVRILIRGEGDHSNYTYSVGLRRR